MSRSSLKINIFRRTSPLIPPRADANIIIDVLRAFTTAHVAFENGIDSIYLTDGIDEARSVKERNPDYLLVGERGGIPVEGFDCGNSPSALVKFELANRNMVFRTSNGTRAALEAIAAPYVMAAALVNARATAEYLLAQDDIATINIIATAFDDDDFACAEYIAGMLDPEAYKPLSVDSVSERIRKCQTAEKFHLNREGCFPIEDLELASREAKDAMALRVKVDPLPRLVRIKT